MGLRAKGYAAKGLRHQGVGAKSVPPRDWAAGGFAANGLSVPKGLAAKGLCRQAFYRLKGALRLGENQARVRLSRHQNGSGLERPLIRLIHNPWGSVQRGFWSVGAVIAV